VGRHELPALVPLQVKNRIHVLRAEMRWTQAELAERLNVSRQTINALETEKYDPSLQLAFGISKLFGKPMEEIFLFEADDAPSNH
jgi:putative transcriptional regulator